jgi:uncharacterized membrane protein (UPF0127 family)
MWKTATIAEFDPKLRIEADGKVYRVRVPQTEAEMNRGYRQVYNIARDECMLFKYERDQPVIFTMMHCFVGLRIVFCDAQFKVLRVADALPGMAQVPCNNPKCRNVIEFALKPSPPHIFARDIINVTSSSTFDQHDVFLKTAFNLSLN